MLQEDEALIDGYLDSLSLTGESPRCYRDHMRLFANLMEPRGGLAAASPGDVAEWLEGSAPATHNSRLSILRSFYRWLSVESCLPLNPISAMRNRRAVTVRERRPLSRSEAERAASSAPDERDELVCRLVLCCGLKPAEVTGLSVRDVSETVPTQVLCGPVGRWGRRRLVELDEATGGLARRAAERRAACGAGPLEPLVASRSNNNRGGRVTTRTVGDIVRGALAAIGTAPGDVSARGAGGRRQG